MIAQFFAAANLTERSLAPCAEPWSFSPTDDLTAQVRHDKVERQRWYQDPTTRHNFYTAFEGGHPGQRITKRDNPPRSIHAVVVDYDMPLSKDRIDEAVAKMKFKPSWIETSLAGNSRLVFLFSKSLRVPSYEFAVALLQKCKKWLGLELLPGLDEPALTAPERLYCNGCDWRSTGHGAIPENHLQSFFMKIVQDFEFVGTDEASVPLDVVESELKKKYPKFDWTTEFALESQGPSFWVEGSESPMSAIVKKDGMFTFSAHAEKQFYSWGDLLGSEFMEEFTATSLEKATKDIYYDGQSFWTIDPEHGFYVSQSKDVITSFFRVNCRLSDKPDKTGTSPLMQTFNYLYRHRRITGAAPRVFLPKGVYHMGDRIQLNTINTPYIRPAVDPTVWGPDGKFPFISAYFDRLFCPKEQLPHFLAWYQYFYRCALDEKQRPGQAVYLMGGVGSGKTFGSQQIVGVSMGGFIDASDFIAKGGAFNSHLLSVPLWCVDDDKEVSTEQHQAFFQASIKKLTANQTHLHNEKFRVASMTTWAGRVICTANLDFMSSRVLGNLANGTLDKISVFRCYEDEDARTNSQNNTFFKNRDLLVPRVEGELPHFLKWLTDWTIPDSVRADSRYGVASFHEASLIEQAAQGTREAPFFELLVEELRAYFETNPDAKEWRGTTTRVARMISSNPANDTVVRGMRLESAHRYLDLVHRSKRIQCYVTSDAMKNRIWVFPRDPRLLEVAPARVLPQGIPEENTANNPFAKAQ